MLEAQLSTNLRIGGIDFMSGIPPRLFTDETWEIYLVTVGRHYIQMVALTLLPLAIVAALEEVRVDVGPAEVRAAASGGGGGANWGGGGGVKGVAAVGVLGAGATATEQ